MSRLPNNRLSYSMWPCLLFVGALVALVLLPEAAWAGPGGIIKAARPALGKLLVIIAVCIVISPYFIYLIVRGTIQRRKVERDLALLAKRYEQYRWLDINDRVHAVFYWVWSSWGQQKMEMARHHTTSWYWQNQQMLLDEWARRGVVNICYVVQLESIEPIFIQHNEARGGEGSRLVVEINARVVDYLQETATGNIVQGDTGEGDLSTVWTFVWQDGDWRLNLIEDGALQWKYLCARNEVPASLLNPAAAS